MGREKIVPALTIGIIGYGLARLSTFAFSPDVRQRMFARDQGECQTCGKRFRDGWLLDCSHDDHDHSKDNYNDINNGRVQCLEDHLAYHEELGDKNGAYLIRRRIGETQGGRTRDWIAKHK